MSLSRRKFLIRTAQGVVIFGLFPGMTACEGLTRKQEEKDPGYGALVSQIGRERTEILWYASFAPSSHNVQPWTVTIKSPNNWIIGSAEDRWLNEVDPKNREMLLSIGAFLENMVTVAKTYGFQVSIRTVARNPFDPELVSVELQNGERMEYPLQRLLERRTVRTDFKSENIDLQDFSFLVDGDEGFYYYPSESTRALWLDEATVAATEQQVNRENVQEELARWIRWSDADASKYRNGLTPEAMDITGLAGWYVRNFYGSRDVLGKDFRKATVEHARQQVAQSGGWIVTTSENDRITSLIEAGRRFERMFLRAKDRSVGIHPMSQVLQEAPWSEEVAEALKLEKPPQFLLRVGYLRDYPSPVSLRMPLDEFTKV
ncbi:MAG: nitroreductase family protein [Chlorobiales bacterium]|nr:nitroreductase family protein [Chlorobiales bacterium]